MPPRWLLTLSQGPAGPSEGLTLNTNTNQPKELEQ
jgi:hypothetical protein